MRVMWHIDPLVSSPPPHHLFAPTLRFDPHDLEPCDIAPVFARPLGPGNISVCDPLGFAVFCFRSRLFSFCEIEHLIFFNLSPC